ncbi:MAG: M20/M25/M40 family metallo-hydrolase [Rhodobacteraceae bacterium]|jgi:acetylornithine deacetylase/succinyl-diaminopimelate desuccinylase-like protein|nr:M20/M25/M40 family metallo-hydrolase [Paracoccaceae bacterium]
MKSDVEWMRDVVVEVLRAPSQVPPGQTEIRPGDPAIAAVVSDVVLPRIEELGPDEIRRHPDGDVAARFGPKGDGGLLLQTYIVSQHANMMEPGKAGTVIPGDGPLKATVLGQGASQNKGAMAAALTALRSLPGDLDHPVWLTVNTEGKSSHDGSRRILDDLGVTAAAGILMTGTDLRVSLGNRGRVDVNLTVEGKSSHSSQPWLGANPIEVAADVVHRLRTLPLPERHPVFGPVSATPYQFACHPVSPHTIPAEVRLVIDRRLLPGESPDGAVDDLRSHLTAALPDARLRIETGEVMLPALVPDDAPVVMALRDGLKARGRTGDLTMWSMNTFDAGYACSKGIPTVMFGPGRRQFTGSEMLGDDFVSLGDMWTAVEVLRGAIGSLCRS